MQYIFCNKVLLVFVRASRVKWDHPVQRAKTVPQGSMDKMGSQEKGVFQDHR